MTTPFPNIHYILDMWTHKTETLWLSFIRLQMDFSHYYSKETLMKCMVTSLDTSTTKLSSLLSPSLSWKKKLILFSKGKK